MSKTIKLNSDLKYRNQLNELSNYLGEVEVELLTKGINLAAQGNWKKWANDMEKSGDIAFIDVNSIRDSGDPNVDYVVELIDTILFIKNKIDNP